MFQNGSNSPKKSRMAYTWSKMVQYCPKWSNMVCYGLIWCNFGLLHHPNGSGINRSRGLVSTSHLKHQVDISAPLQILISLHLDLGLPMIALSRLCCSTVKMFCQDSLGGPPGGTPCSRELQASPHYNARGREICSKCLM